MNRGFPLWLVVIGALVMANVGCVTPQQEVTTHWQKLGIPQAFNSVRDNLKNRRGNRPQRERKPKLLKLADPKLKELEGKNVEAIKVAQEIKAEEDLAAQKIKAIKYLGLIGCSCYDDEKKIQGALLKALSDCTPCVRLAAISAIHTSIDQSDRHAQAFKRDRERCARGDSPGGQGCSCQTGSLGCGLCQGRGCASCAQPVCTYCNGYGCEYCAHPACGQCGGIGCRFCASAGCRSQVCITSSCDMCSDSASGCGSCGSCSNCCTKDIQERLRKMAYEKDDHGCWYEPVAKIRAAAAALLQRCPPIAEPPKQPIEEPKRPIEGAPLEGAKNGEAGGEEKKTENQNDSNQNNATESTEDSAAYGQWNNSQTTAMADSLGAGRNPANWASYQNSTAINVTNQSIAQSVPSSQYQATSTAADDNLIGGQIYNVERTFVDIRLNDSYHLPQGAQIVVWSADGFQQQMSILASNPGRLYAKPVSMTELHQWKNGDQLYVGVIGN